MWRKKERLYMSKEEEYLEKAEGRLNAAELLLEEGFLEDAVSRAYYSMYNAAKAALSSRDKNAKTHKGLFLC